MGLLGTLLKTGFDVVTAPIEVVKDVVTIGGVGTDTPEGYTVRRANRLLDDLDDIREELEDL